MPLRVAICTLGAVSCAGVYGVPGGAFQLAHAALIVAACPRADIEIQANEILHHKLTLNGYLAEFTGQSMEQITQARSDKFAYSKVPQCCTDLLIFQRAKPLCPVRACAANSQCICSYGCT